MKTLSRSLLAGAALAFAGGASAFADCDASRSWTLDFSAEGAQDTVSVDTLGPDCASAVVALVVRGTDGRIVFADIWPLVWFSNNMGELGEAGANLDRINPTMRSGSSLSPVEDMLEGEREWLETSPEAYSHARQSDAPVLCYNTGHEGGRCIWYDAEFGGGEPLSGNGA